MRTHQRAAPPGPLHGGGRRSFFILTCASILMVLFGIQRPAVDIINKHSSPPLLLSWTYGTTPYDRQLIEDDPAYFQSRNLPWVGCTWTDPLNVNLWADAVRNASTEYGGKSAASGMLTTNWMGGRLEAGLLPTARKSWNLADRSGPH